MEETKKSKTKNVYEKLQEARVLLQKKNTKKSGKNKFANFSYYELGDFIPSVNEIFNDLKLISLFNIDEKENKATLEIVNIENTEEKIVFQSPLAEAEIKGSTPIQCLGGIHTYMKRYLYLNALEIVESDMFDGKVGDKQNELKEGKKVIKKDNKSQVAPDYRDMVIRYCNDNALDINTIANRYKLNGKSTNDDFKYVYEKMQEIEKIHTSDDIIQAELFNGE